MQKSTFQRFLAVIFLKSLRFIVFISISLTWLSLISSCQDNIQVTDPPPGSESSQPIKTISMDSVQVSTEAVDKVKTNNLTRYLTGIYFDTVFGQVKANLFVDFELPEEGFSGDFLTNRSNNIDSAVLILPYADNNDFMGSPQSTQNWDLYELNEQIKTQDKTTYFSNSDLAYANSPLTKWSGSFKPNKKDNLKINLSDDFINKFENASSSDLKGSQSFHSFFQGLAIIPQDNFQNKREGAILNWELTDGAGIVFYHNEGTKDTISITDNSGTVNTFDLDKKNALAASGEHPNYGFIQPMAGLKLTLQFPNDRLKRLTKNGKVTVHKATINVPADKNYHQVIQPPESMFLFNEDEADIRFLDTAQYRSNSSRFLFNNPTYFQRLLNSYAEGEEQMLSGLTIAAPNDQLANDLPYSANPLLVPKTNNNEGKGVNLRLIYSNVTNQ